MRRAGEHVRDGTWVTVDGVTSLCAMQMTMLCSTTALWFRWLEGPAERRPIPKAAFGSCAPMKAGMFAQRSGLSGR